MSEKNPFFGATFAERKAARLAAEGKKPAEKAEVKQIEADEVDDVENKAVVAKKTTRKRAAKKS